MNNRPQHPTLVPDVAEQRDTTANSEHTNAAHAEFEALLARAWRVQQSGAALHSAAAWRSAHASRKRVASSSNG